MDIDSDVDGRLAQQFGCLGTVDRDILVNQFQQILGPYVNLSPESCRFFLDMNNWNLQAALGSYYDYNAQDQLRLPNMIFVKDVTIGEGESVPPNTKFLKTWRLKNSGDEIWPDGCMLRYIGGEIQAETDSTVVKSVQPLECVDVSIEMTSPSSKGVYCSRWQMNAPNGIPFGEPIWCIVVVEENGLLSLTQRLAATHCGEKDAADHTRDVTNPFGPTKFQSSYQTDDVFLSSDPTVSAQCTLDASGSRFCCGRVDLDPSASPNGSSSLHAAVSAAFPEYNTRMSLSIPVNTNCSSTDSLPSCREMSLVPHVPPSTPCSPTAILQQIHFSSNSSPSSSKNCGESSMDET